MGPLDKRYCEYHAPGKMNDERGTVSDRNAIGQIEDTGNRRGAFHRKLISVEKAVGQLWELGVVCESRQIQVIGSQGESLSYKSR